MVNDDDQLVLRASAGVPVVLVIFALFPLAMALLIHGVAVKVICGALVAFLGWAAFATGSRRLTLDSRGVTAKGVFGTTQLSWDEVDHYTFWSQDQQVAYAAGAQGGLIGVLVATAVVAAVRAAKKKKADHSRFSMGALKLHASDGRKIVIDVRYKNPAQALERAFDEVHPRLRARPRLDFSPFTLGNDLHHAKKGSLALPEISKVVAAGPRLSVHKQGKRLAWVGVRMSTVMNSMLLLEELGERGIVVNPSAGMFVPPTVLEKLRAASSRQAALPAARVVSRD